MESAVHSLSRLVNLLEGLREPLLWVPATRLVLAAPEVPVALLLLALAMLPTEHPETSLSLSVTQHSTQMLADI
jgi:hypothetical protein